MTERMQRILAPGRVAVVTGAAKGIGAAAARAFAAKGMKLALLDRDEESLAAFSRTLDADVLIFVGDVSDLPALSRFRDETYGKFGDVSLLMNNAGVSQGAGPWADPAEWRPQLEVNFGGVLNAQHAFVPHMLLSDEPCAIVNLGSKQGITTPPGNAAYAVAKAAIKVLTEQLAHELRNTPDSKVSAHLFVPGYTWTPMNFPGVDTAVDVKPPEPWTAEQLIEYFLNRLADEDFYILCPDNDVTQEVDAKRIRWAAEDIILNRPALSRWHKDWRDRFTAWMTN